MEELKAGMAGVRVTKKCLLAEGGYSFRLSEILAVRKREADGKKLLDIVYALNDADFDKTIDVFYGEDVDDIIRDEDGTLKIVITAGENCAIYVNDRSICSGRKDNCQKQQ